MNIIKLLESRISLHKQSIEEIPKTPNLQVLSKLDKEKAIREYLIAQANKQMIDAHKGALLELEELLILVRE